MTILQKHLVFIPVSFVVFAGFFGWLVMLLWNWLMPAIFGLPALTFWQAAGLLVLCKILFGSVGGGHHCHHGHHGHHACCGNIDHNKLRERWENMTPEERKRIVEIHKGICTNEDNTNDGE